MTTNGMAATTNAISGHAHTGHVVQAREIHAVTFHCAQPPVSPPIPCQLLPVPATFTDRTADLEALTGSLAALPVWAVGIVVIHGVGGVGKTALATRMLQGLREQFPGGLLYVDLGGYAPTGPASTGETLGHLVRSYRNGPLPDDLEDLTSLWRSVTAHRRVAVLLDNATSACQVRPLLPGGAGHLVVVTSRDRLADLVPDGAVLHRLAPLDPGAAAELLARYVGRSRVDGEPVALSLLVERCARLPLALGLAAASLAARPDASLAEITEHLNTPPAGNIEGVAVSTTAECTYQQLPPRTRSVYRALAVLPAVDIDVAMTAAASALPRDEAQRELHLLAEQRLVEDAGTDPHRGRLYRLHDEVRSHARRCAEHEDSEQARAQSIRRLLDFLLAAGTMAEARLTPTHRQLDRDYLYPPAEPVAFTGNVHALAWLTAMQANYAQALREASAAGLDAMTWQLVHAWWPMFHLVRPNPLRLEANELALAAARRTGNRPAIREMANTSGVCLRGYGRYDEAIELCTEALRLARQDGDELGTAQHLHDIGATHQAAGRAEDARPYLTKALDVRRRLQYPRGIALTQLMLGLVELDTHHPAAAVDLLTEARNQLVAVNDPFDSARALAWLGRARAACQDYAAAERDLRQALEEFQAPEVGGAPQWAARTYEFLGQTAQDQEDVQAARQHYEQSVSRYGMVSPRDAERVRARLHTVNDTLATKARSGTSDCPRTPCHESAPPPQS